MARWIAWKRFTKENIARLQDGEGEYEIAARNKIVISSGGSNKGVKGRLMERFIHGRNPTGYFFRCRYAEWLGFDSGIQMEAKTASRHKAKRGGKNLKDNKRSPHIRNIFGF